MYKVGQGPQKERKRRHRRVIFWLILLLIVLLAIVIAVIVVRGRLKPKPAVIKQSAAVNTAVSYNTPTTRYSEPDFSINLPTTWQPVPRPPGPYQSYTWETSDSGTDGEQLVVYEDTIPVNLAVNHLLVVQGEVDHLQLEGAASDNCSNFTKNVAGLTPAVVGTPAKWQGISFLCDQSNPQRDVVGTSSADGINMVILKDQSTDTYHKFFFTYTNDSYVPDYTDLYNALNSFRMN